MRRIQYALQNCPSSKPQLKLFLCANTDYLEKEAVLRAFLQDEIYIYPLLSDHKLPTVLRVIYLN